MNKNAINKLIVSAIDHEENSILHYKYIPEPICFARGCRLTVLKICDIHYDLATYHIDIKKATIHLSRKSLMKIMEELDDHLFSEKNFIKSPFDAEIYGLSIKEKDRNSYFGTPMFDDIYEVYINEQT